MGKAYVDRLRWFSLANIALGILVCLEGFIKLRSEEPWKVCFV